ncbi:MAG: homoserine O-acetyltransferase MetX [Capsulimonadaceae bacterium]
MEHRAFDIPVGNCGADYVETLTAHLVRPPDTFLLESGEHLPELNVAYEAYGTLNETGDNAVLICHGFTASAHAAGLHHAGSFTPGWWDPLIGPGKAFDTDRYFVVCSNVLGGCKGTTGPCSIDPRTGKPYGPSFPQITIGDMIAAQRRLLDYLGVRHLLSVAGASMGGMQALEWGLRFPETTLSAIPIGCAVRWSAQAVALSAAGRLAIEADAEFYNGEYYGRGRPVMGLAAARMIGHITYVSADFLEIQREAMPESDVLHYFEDECERFVGRFDANSYITLSLAMERFDVSRFLDPEYAGHRSPEIDWLLLSFSSDWLFPPEQHAEIHAALLQRGHCSRHVTIPTIDGHDAFLTEPHKYATEIAEFLDAVAFEGARADLRLRPVDAEAPSWEHAVRARNARTRISCGVPLSKP